MKYKMTAVLVALAMMFAGVFVMADGDGSGADDKTSTASNKITLVAGGDEVSTILMLNYNAYEKMDSRTIVWSVIKGTEGTATEIDASSEVTIDSITFKIENVKDNSTETAKYKLTMSASGTTAVDAADYTIAAKVTVTVKSGESNSYTLDLGSYSYKVNITVDASGPTTATIEDMTAFSDYYEFTKGKSVSAKVVVTGFDSTKYNMYATGLPAGLGLAKDGTLAGFVKGDVGAFDCKVTLSKVVFGSETPIIYGNIALKIKVVAPTTASVVLTFEGAKVISSDTSGSATMTFAVNGTDVTNPTPSGSAVVTQGTAATFSIGDAMTATSVKAVKDDGTVAEITADSSTPAKYTLNTAGTGTYRVIINGSAGGYENVTLTFVLSVVADMQGEWSPAIVINGN